VHHWFNTRERKPVLRDDDDDDYDDNSPSNLLKTLFSADNKIGVFRCPGR
jgi:hypothetical protein